MKDITTKTETARVATAQARLQAPPAVLRLLRERTLEKGDALEIARAAGVLAAKRTWELIPLCHPLPLQKLDIRYEFGEDFVTIYATAGVRAATGVEMEALTAVSLCALTLYDMLKPHAGLDLTIGDICLLEKTGGKSGVLKRRPQ